VHWQAEWENCPVTVFLNTTLRFLFWLVLLIFEGSLVIAFYVAPLFQTRQYNTHPDIGLEMDVVLRGHPGLKGALILYLALFLFGNVGLIVMIWRSFKSLRLATWK
jgi:hypothetical protein